MSRPAPELSGPRVAPVDGLPPVLYLDIDDTLLRYPDGREGDPRPAPGAAAFLSWALERFEVRWLTRWCPTGEMETDRVRSFCRMLEADPERVGRIRGLNWMGSDTKLDGITWLEHVVLGRPFLWIEDEYGLGQRERAFLRLHGFDDRWRHCNVTERPGALRALHGSLRRRGW